MKKTNLFLRLISRVTLLVPMTITACSSWFLSMSVLLFSCTAPIDIHTRDSDPVTVVYGCLTNEYKNQHIRITSSSPYFYDSDNPAITDAKVNVTSSNGREYPFVYDKNGYYISQRRFSAIPGTTYRLSVEVNSGKDGAATLYEAETTTLPIVPVDSIGFNVINLMGFKHYSLIFYMQEPAETENYYLFNFYINDSISNEKISNSLISNDMLYNGEYIDGASVTFFEDGTDPKVIEWNEDNENAFMVVPGDRIRLHILNIEKGYYEFISHCMHEKYGENPLFGGPPSNIHTNLSNGAIGYFSSYCIHEKVTVVP